MNFDTFFADLLLLSWLDLGFIIFTLLFIAHTIRCGTHQSLLHLVWFMMFFVIATYSYDLLTHHIVFKWIVSDDFLRPISAFLLIFLALYLLRIFCYFVLKSSLNIHNPCWFNGILFWLAVLLIGILTALFTGEVFIYKTHISAFISDKGMQNYISTFVITLAIMSVVFGIIVFFNIKLTEYQTCRLKKFYELILNTMHCAAYLTQNTQHIKFKSVLLAIPIGVMRAWVLLIALFLLFSQTNINYETIIIPYFKNFTLLLAPFFTHQLPLL